MEEIALTEKVGNCTSLQIKKAKESIVVWRKKRKRGAWLKDFPKGHKFATLYTEEEQKEIVELIAQKIVMESLSLLDAIDELIKSGEIPGNRKESVKWLICRWGYKNPELKEILKSARSERAYALVEQIQELDIDAITTYLLGKNKDGSPVKEIDKIDPKIANAFATLHKNRTANLQWLAERISPDDFSPKMQIAGKIEHTLVSMQIILPVEK